MDNWSKEHVNAVRLIVAELDRRIEELQSVRGTLLETFGESTVFLTGKGKTLSEMSKMADKEEVDRLTPGVKKITRSDQIAMYLRAVGPASLGDIRIALPDVPDNSISWVLSKDPKFVRRDDGVWDVAYEPNEDTE